MATRNKYQFKDRAEAEAAWKKEKNQAWLAELALGAILQNCQEGVNRVEWFRGRWYDVARVGRDRSDGGAVVVVFHNKSGKERHHWSTTVYGPGPALKDYQKLSRFSPTTSDGQELRDLLGKAVGDWVG